MYNKIDYKKKIIPKKWFFYDLASDKDQKTLSSLSKNIGVVFFCNYKKKSYIFSKSIKPLLDYCKRNGIVFIIPFSKCLIKEFMALGILFNFKDFK